MAARAPVLLGLSGLPTRAWSLKLLLAVGCDLGGLLLWLLVLPCLAAAGEPAGVAAPAGWRPEPSSSSIGSSGAPEPDGAGCCCRCLISVLCAGAGC
jgi:hypothetical protein